MSSSRLTRFASFALPDFAFVLHINPAEDRNSPVVLRVNGALARYGDICSAYVQISVSSFPLIFN